MPKPSHARASRQGGCEPSGPQIQRPRPTRGEPGPQPPRSSARRRFKDATSEGGPAPTAERKAPLGTARRGRLAPERKRPPTDPTGLSAAFLLRGARGKPRKRKGTPKGPPSQVLSCASPPRARATRPGGRRRPSLPQGRPCSTIGAGRLNFRVRYGSGCAPAAVAAGPRGALRRGLRRAGRRSQGALGAAQRLRKVSLENGRERRDVVCVPKGSAD